MIWDMMAFPLRDLLPYKSLSEIPGDSKKHFFSNSELLLYQKQNKAPFQMPYTSKTTTSSTFNRLEVGVWLNSIVF